ncbi:ras-domain-containing protein [Dacryopinax primogenitus]|uniref:Ras-domain-containing protein n=1 Tax=Dacryopinax primogenitus (strain DJM 731) TaxID=1858805 RepID=M5FP41_DACPD|nr:ras-domain-containing protein [Dacryopinax primogenitus]EJT98185.1 ras-domain-containing protein [Dacryopinax primogenitus]
MASDPATSAPANLKILLIGDSSVGKSSLLLRFSDQSFLSEEESSATIGVDFKVQRIEVDGVKYKLSIWDTAGQERFRTITSSYYRGAQGVILVYDVSSRESFDDLPRWFTELETYCGPSVAKVIVGNKIDKEFSRRVPTAEGQAYAERMGALFLESSAKRGIHVDEVFQTIVRKIVATPELWQKNKPGTANVNTMPGAGVRLEQPGQVEHPGCGC